MKLALITTLPSLKENDRIASEAKNMGLDFELVDLGDFSFFLRPELDQRLVHLDCDVMIVRGIFSSIKPIAAVIGSLRKKGIRVFDNNFLGHTYLIDKVSDILKLSLNNIPVPKTAYSRNFQDYLSMADELGYPVIFKSSRMGKGANVFKLDNKPQLEELIKDLMEQDKNAKGYLMQEFVDYEYDLRVLVIGERIFCMKRIPAEGEFRANFSLGGKVELFPLDSDGQALARQALKAIGMSVGGVDILIDRQNKRYILEVNHTAGMIGMEEATGENITQIYLNHAINSAY